MADPPTALDATLQVLQAGSIVIASIMAFRSVNAWCRESLGRRKIELAEQMLSSFYQARDHIQQARTLWPIDDDGPPREVIEQEADEERVRRDTLYAPAKLLKGHAKPFTDMEAASYRFAAFFGQGAREPIKQLLLIRNTVILASMRLLSRDEEKSKGIQDMPREDATRYEAQLKTIIRRDENGNDDVSKDLAKAVAEMEAICQPVLQGRPSLWQQFASVRTQFKNGKLT